MNQRTTKISCIAELMLKIVGLDSGMLNSRVLWIDALPFFFHRTQAAFKRFPSGFLWGLCSGHMSCMQRPQV